MRLVAQRDRVAHMEATFVESRSDPWMSTFVDPLTGDRWRRVQLGAEYHGGGVPILLKEPMPDIAELLELAARSSQPPEIAASAWLLADTDREGTYKEQLVAIAEAAADGGDQTRAALLVGWGCLNDEMNLRPPTGKHISEITDDHEHFRRIAARARQLLRLGPADPMLRDPKVFAFRD